jgi:hypothetical protein|tara:strand:- start:46 stop:249 length:204 start_codon:yes stop_codon:yes gene_type:complete
MIPYDLEEIVEFLIGTTLVSRDRKSLDPDLRFLAVLADMYVRGFITIKAVEFKSPASPLEHLWHVPS